MLTLPTTTTACGGDASAASASLLLCMDPSAVTAVLKSWEYLKTTVPDIWTVLGELIFANFFETSPTALTLFPFGNNNHSGNNKDDSTATFLPAMFQDARFRAHSSRVTETLDWIVTNLMDLDDVRDLLVDLGARHYHYKGGVVVDEMDRFLEPMTQAILAALETLLHKEDFWCFRLKQSWLDIIHYVTSGMKEGLDQAVLQARNNHNSSLSSSSVEDEMTASSTTTTIALEASAITQVLTHWETIKRVPNSSIVFGQALFAKFFELTPEALQLFAFGQDGNEDDDDLFQNPLFVAHSERMMETLDVIVTSCLLHCVEDDDDDDDEEDGDRSYLRELGERHAQLYWGGETMMKASTIRRYMASMQSALLHALHQTLQEAELWTPSLQDSWRQVIAFFLGCMMDGVQRTLPKTTTHD